MSEILLCACRESLSNPADLGLPEEELLCVPWLSSAESGEEARSLMKRPGMHEAWVIDPSDIEPINLAASLKADRPDARICLISFSESGSLRSRAHAANIDALYNRALFVKRYMQAKCAAASLGRSLLPARVGGDVVVSDPSSDGTDASVSSPTIDPRPHPVDPGVACRNEREVEGTPTRVSSGRGFVLSVASGSGGAGKSTIAVLSALQLRSQGLSVALLDADLQFGDASGLMGAIEALSIEEVAEHPEVLGGGCESKSVTLVSAGNRPERAEEIVGLLPAVIEALADCFDVVVVNTGSFWDESHAVVLERSEKALLLIDQRFSSLRAAQRCLDLCARCGIATVPFVLVVNRVSRNSRISAEDASGFFDDAPVSSLRDGGWDVEEMLAAGLSDELLSSRNELCSSLANLLDGVVPFAGKAADGSDKGRRSSLFCWGSRRKA